MRKEERKIYTKCITGMAIAVVAAVILMTRPVRAEKAVFTDDSLAVDNFTADDAETDLRAVFDENSAMPCCDRESFEKWMETYEQEQETCEQETEPEPEPTTVPTDECKVTTGTDETPVTFYSVNGETLNPELQRYLYSRLQEFGCEWFFRYSLCQLYQESRYDSNAVGKRGLDCGLCQFRYPYFPSVAEEAGLFEYDIFNPVDSIYVYTYLMCKYLNETGGDVAMSLSLYYSGYGGPYSSEYVKDVTQWFETMKEVGQ
jgi:hypothetical protein